MSRWLYQLSYAPLSFLLRDKQCIKNDIANKVNKKSKKGYEISSRQAEGRQVESHTSVVAK